MGKTEVGVANEGVVMERAVVEVLENLIGVAVEDEGRLPQVPGAEKRALHDVQYSDVVPHHPY